MYEPTNCESVRRAGRRVKHILYRAPALCLSLALLAALVGCHAGPARQSYRLRLAGAQIPVELAVAWLDDAKTCSFDVQQVGPVYLSQHGFQNLRDHACDIACVDRKLTTRELADMGDLKLRGYRVAFYGYALYVHPDNPIDSIFAGHLGLIFKHKFTDWSQLGAPYEGPIRLIGPEKSTRGGMILMQQVGVWFDDASWETYKTDLEIVDQVAADPYALGFAAVGFDQNTRYVGLRMRRTAPPAFPSLDEIESEKYGLAKVIYLYMPEPLTPAAQAVLDYLFSEDGRDAMDKTHVWSVAPDRAHVGQP